ncbi:MAG: acyl--CoA ligase [SAR324 cluster bacterium]|nr:acyl--CoA ligase [SAR324 cluster bacterium]
MKSASNLSQLLELGTASSTAISAPDRASLTYAGLRELANRTRESLNASGIGRTDRVAIVLPNGPEMATAFVAIATAATTAPLNPGYKQEEFEFYLEDLRARALVVEAGSTSPAVEAARKQGISILELTTEADRAAGDFDLKTDSANNTEPPGPSAADDIALILHTSGTTSRPKIVPLSHKNVTASASNIAASLALTTEDRCLNVMPLFHIHGLIAAVLSSLRAGASIHCTPGFNALRFFSWMEATQPTWYTAVPTMHQAVLVRADKNRTVIDAVPLRLIRSSSSSLPPQVFAELEATFGVPVIEAYGMTEASHQMASNPLPPAERKAGTVGTAAGPEVAIMNESGDLLEPGAIGEIVIRGNNVTSGYENNPKANAENFTNGWFRTGDQGVMDGQGYLSITGRLKEIINRGGEKISPREVDDVLMDHPAVQQIVTFAMPHDKLGEEVAAVVVLREGAEATVQALRSFAGERLAAFKVPRKILFLEEIPKGATGKLQRIGLAEKLGLA